MKNLEIKSDGAPPALTCFECGEAINNTKYYRFHKSGKTIGEIADQFYHYKCWDRDDNYVRTNETYQQFLVRVSGKRSKGKTKSKLETKAKTASMPKSTIKSKVLSKPKAKPANKEVQAKRQQR